MFFGLIPAGLYFILRKPSEEDRGQRSCSVVRKTEKVREKAAAVKAAVKESHSPASRRSLRAPETTRCTKNTPTCICIAREHVQVRSFLQLRSHSNYTMRPQHAGSRAQPAVRNKRACCDANGYGCTEGQAVCWGARRWTSAQKTPKSQWLKCVLRELLSL